MLTLHILRIGVVALFVVVGQGCSSTHALRATDSGSGYASTVVAAAARVVGVPYRYGGFTSQGFDCSGLVYYAYAQAGIPVPRTTRAQLRHARPVPLDDLRPGDVLFFETDGKKVSHVGIYAGAGSFVHAPSRGKKVSYASLESPYWSSRLTGAGRFD